MLAIARVPTAEMPPDTDILADATQARCALWVRGWKLHDQTVSVDAIESRFHKLN